MKRFAARASVVVVGSRRPARSGCAVSQAQMTAGSGDVVADRQRLMKLNGASARDMNDKLKAGKIEAIAVNAETIAINAQHIPSLFPKGSMTDKSKAKPEIWEKWSEFEAAAKNLAGQGRGASRRRPGEGPAEGRGPDEGLRPHDLRHLPHAVPEADQLDAAARLRDRRGAGGAPAVGGRPPRRRAAPRSKLPKLGPPRTVRAGVGECPEGGLTL